MEGIDGRTGRGRSCRHGTSGGWPPVRWSGPRLRPGRLAWQRRRPGRADLSLARWLIRLPRTGSDRKPVTRLRDSRRDGGPCQSRDSSPGWRTASWPRNWAHLGTGSRGIRHCQRRRDQLPAAQPGRDGAGQRLLTSRCPGLGAYGASRVIPGWQAAIRALAARRYQAQQDGTQMADRPGTGGVTGNATKASARERRDGTRLPGPGRRGPGRQEDAGGPGWLSWSRQPDLPCCPPP